MSAANKQDANWTEQWPKAAGFFWFYGYPSKISAKTDVPILVEVWKGAQDFVYVGGGEFMFPEGGGHGFWCKADIPTPPKLD